MYAQYSIIILLISVESVAMSHPFVFLARLEVDHFRWSSERTSPWLG